jgi:hypothetical protein
MSLDNHIRQIKGGLLFVTFFAVGVSLYFQKGIGTIHYVQEIGFEPNIIIAMFFISAFACAYIGFKCLAWNLLWYFPFVIYTGATWLNISERIANPSYTNTPPLVAGFFYSALLGFLVLDWYQDWKGKTWIKTP